MVQVEGLTKYYGQHAAIREVAFHINPGEVVGFLGLNGAGKTTTLKILGCVLLPTSGRVTIDGHDAVREPHEVRKRIGFLPDTPPLYDDMTVGEYLAYVARLRDVPANEARARVTEAEEKAALREVAEALISTLSHGYRQRVGVAQALVHRPAFLILDEPTSGLDPAQIRAMRELLAIMAWGAWRMTRARGERQVTWRWALLCYGLGFAGLLLYTAQSELGSRLLDVPLSQSSPRLAVASWTRRSSRSWASPRVRAS